MSLIAAYSSPFILLAALGLSMYLSHIGVSGGLGRLLILSASFPIGSIFGRIIYLKRSHVEIVFDDETFQVFKGQKKIAEDRWKSYKAVSIVLDQFRRPDLRLYKSLDGEYVDLPISRTNAKPQELRDYVQRTLLK